MKKDFPISLSLFDPFFSSYIFFVFLPFSSLIHLHDYFFILFWMKNFFSISLFIHSFSSLKFFHPISSLIHFYNSFHL
jgi:hypothetical protein